MDERLRKAAELGDIDALYELIGDDADVLRRIDEMEFVDTPLHIAAAKGHTDFAMEMMNLKPSFARKLNQDGFSPIHLALQEGQTQMVGDLLSVDKDLVRVKGREGQTALHYLASMEGNVTDLLSKFLGACPDCITDLNNRKETALHIAAKNDRIQSLEAILRRIRWDILGISPVFSILNLQDKDGDTILHIAATRNQSQIIDRLINLKQVDWNKKNKGGFTALDIILQHTQVNSVSKKTIIFKLKFPMSRLSRLPKKINDCIKGMTPETINALLVVYALVLTMTYQAILSPPAGLSQGDTAGSNKDRVGKSVLSPTSFLSFYIPNGAAFWMAWLITLGLFFVVAGKMMPFVISFYTLMAACYVYALSIIAPSTSTVYYACFAAFIVVGSIAMICSFIF